ncbi:uncharacterized protein (DUF2164 family) [Prosthecobacter fusiformis]|uniref:Uncharacterized protein (DUF2164 family) n=1 Tax=Prosthecobacter fusiformis TaxID=48464 RepID=A0A4R7RWV2_9BACT|nr:DUF2164 domain-containing protein [Prosthecobacter fusiformis]TDU69345.1 uncharacterized protein (DUF2164 family) [Prosthecobacter fusiformis]
MIANLTKEQKAEVISSLQRYTSKELDCDLGDIQAGHLLEYILKEIGPFAYNQGVEDAKGYLASKVEELTGTCFEQGLTYWNASSGGRQIKRKP